MAIPSLCMDKEKVEKSIHFGWHLAYMGVGQLLGGGGPKFQGGGAWQKSSTPFLMHNFFPKKKKTFLIF
jgi:hypothetical protein